MRVGAAVGGAVAVGVGVGVAGVIVALLVAGTVGAAVGDCETGGTSSLPQPIIATSKRATPAIHAPIAKPPNPRKPFRFARALGVMVLDPDGHLAHALVDARDPLGRHVLVLDLGPLPTA